MKHSLLVIDPQNDFIDQPGAALPVAGADADMSRVTNLLARHVMAFDAVALTLDSHAAFGIERPGFWRDSDGCMVPPFTVISQQHVDAGVYTTADPANLERARYVLAQLASAGKYELMVWPTHCVIGTWGHSVVEPLIEQLNQWEQARQRRAAKFLKGTSPYTEHYSAVRAEVALDGDPDTDTNLQLVEWAREATRGGRLYVAGEAGSHCVRATVIDLINAIEPADRANVTLLTDCMSPVPGFEAKQGEFIEFARLEGLQLRTADEAAADLAA